MTRPTVLLAALAASLAASSARAQAPAASAQAKDQYAVFETSRGKIGVKLLPQKAPKAVENFVQLAQGKKPWTDPPPARRSLSRSTTGRCSTASSRAS
jgi:peptidylprolyl isomerase/peptidyl-prolyl cis-trans isomerase A (cyclophilin A)